MSSSTPLLAPPQNSPAKSNKIGLILLSMCAIAGIAFWTYPAPISATASFRKSADPIDLDDLLSSPSFEIMHKSPQGWRAGLTLHRPTGVCEEDPSVKQFSGYLTINSTEVKSFFFWFIETRNGEPKEAPTAVWFSGGPGASSMFALVGENGPCWVFNKTDSGEPIVERNAFSWTEAANMIYVDQPSGTGFSIGAANSVVKSEREVADDMYLFLEAFLLQFPQYGKKIFLVGESFGGHYVTAIAHKIVQMNKQITEATGDEYDPKDPEKKQNVMIPLAGIAIGNGMTDTIEQLKWYPKMAYNSSTAPSIINATTYEMMESKIPQVVQAVRACAQSDDVNQCNEAYELYSESTMLPIIETGANVYDMRLKGPYDFSAMDAYLNLPSVQSAIGARKQWVGVNITVWKELAPIDFLHSFQALIPPILDQGIKILIYAGDQDYICNWLGVHAWTENMDWNGQTQFNAAPTHNWIGGTVKYHEKFAFATVSQAGHMVPMDQPENSLKLFRALLSDGEFDVKQFK
jgi:cathepsin A (carboxypeptidase C)